MCVLWERASCVRGRGGSGDVAAGVCGCESLERERRESSWGVAFCSACQPRAERKGEIVHNNGGNLPHIQSARASDVLLSAGSQLTSARGVGVLGWAGGMTDTDQSSGVLGQLRACVRGTGRRGVQQLASGAQHQAARGGAAGACCVETMAERVSSRMTQWLSVGVFFSSVATRVEGTKGWLWCKRGERSPTEAKRVCPTCPSIFTLSDHSQQVHRRVRVGNCLKTELEGRWDLPTLPHPTSRGLPIQQITCQPYRDH